MHIQEWLQFVISACILGFTIIFARIPFLKASLIIFRPLMAISAGLIWAIDRITGLLAMPFRRRSLPAQE